VATFIEETQKININWAIEQAKYNLTSFIQEEEEKFRQQIENTANFIINKKSNLVFLTGPSSSGKTTTAIFIERELEKQGYHTVRISLDNFYRPRAELPLWPDGSQNFECIEGLDLDFFEDRVNTLIKDGYAKMPRFDFAVGERKPDKFFEVNYDDNTIIIFEGIHALNPKLYERIDDANSTKLYVSVHSDYVDDDGKKYIKAQDVRLCRRIIRDHLHRGTEPGFTLGLWGKVCLGEKDYIRPYRTNSDFSINSMHAYEIFVYKDYMLDYYNTMENKANIEELIGKIEKLPSLYEKVIPKTSLLREFIVY